MPYLPSHFSAHPYNPGSNGGYYAIRRRINIVTSAFLAFSVVLGAVGLWRAYNAYSAVRQEEQLKADALVSRAANQLAMTLNERFADLRFLADSLRVGRSQEHHLRAPIKAMLRQFLATHYNIINVNIIGPRGKTILWSAHPQPGRPILPVIAFQPLIDNPHLEIGHAVFAKIFHTMAVPMRYKIEDRSGAVRFYIGDPMPLDRLMQLIPKTHFDIHLATLGGQTFAVWRNGHFGSPGITLAPPAGEARSIVAGYPWEVSTQWSSATLRHMWWQRVRPWLPLFILLLWGSQYIATLVINLLSREMQLRLWHETLYQINQSILEDSPLEGLFANAATRVQANLVAAFVFVGSRHERATAGPAASQFTDSMLHTAFTIATADEWKSLPVDISPRPMTLALGDTDAVIIIFPSLQTQIIPWYDLVQEMTGQLTSAINQKRQRLEIDRLQRYQAAVSMMQLELLRQPRPDDMYGLLVRVLQEQTDILGAFVAIPEPDSSWLRIQAAAAQSDEIRNALRRLTPSQDPKNRPFGQMLSSRAFRSGTPHGPSDPHTDTDLQSSIIMEPALAPVRAVVAYPLLEEGALISTAVLVVEGTDPNYFTPALLALLEHLVASVRLALSRYRARRQIDRYRAFYEALARASQAMTRSSEPSRLFHNICSILAEYTGVPLTFISLVEGGSARVVATGGVARGFMDGSHVALDPCDDGLGALHAQTMLTSEPCLFETRERWLGNEALRHRAQNLGLESALTIAWAHKNGAPGILGIVAGETGFFDHDLARLMEAFGRDISFAINDYDRQQELLRLSLFDALTGLPNRVQFEQFAVDAMARSAHNGRIMALGIMDLDGFKEWNDLQGHRAGDNLLKTVSGRLHDVMNGENGVARLGGDEFGLVVSLDNAGELAALSARLLDAVAQADSGKRVSASLGWALYTVNEIDYTALLAHADEALYAAKDEGRNTFRLFGGEIAERLKRRLQIQQWFPIALEERQIFFMLQPQASCVTGAVEGVEILARWRTPEGILSADRFIPDVEKDPRLIRELGRRALTEAVALRARLLAAGHPLRVAFNIGALHFLHPAFLDEVSDCLGRERAEGLCIEVTENVALTDTPRAAEVIERLKVLGFTVALDDFGTGYSSLNEAVQLPVDELKLDQRFIRSFRRDPNAFAVASAALMLGYLSGRRLIAEGIEEPDDLALWHHMGGNYIQGYLLAKPLTEPDFHSWLKTLEPTYAHRGAVFPPKDLTLVGYAFLERDSYATCNPESMRAGLARLLHWIDTRRALYSHLPNWPVLETALRHMDHTELGTTHDFCVQELRPAVQALFRDIDAMLQTNVNPAPAPRK